MDRQFMKLFILSLVALSSAAATDANEQLNSTSDSDDPCAVVDCGFGESCTVVDGEPKCQCPSICPVYIRYAPICASDGNSYADTCQMDVAACKQGKHIYKLYDGECGAAETTKSELTCATVLCGIGTTCQVVDGQARCECFSNCPLNYDPVCGSDGKTYGNECQLNYAICKSQGELKKVSHGECQVVDDCARVRCGYGSICRIVNGKAKCECPSVCTKEYQPVCGSDGKTYGNQCELDNATCESQGRIRKVSDGKCPPVDECSNVQCKFGARCRVVDGKAKCECPEICPLIYKPVCGSDGKTYDNMCRLNIAACKSNGEVKFASNGPCRQQPLSY